MFSTLRTRFGIPGLISTIALVFAMTGGAFAAKYLITSPKQIKPSVLKKLKGATGPAGATGAQGAAGAQGAVGPTGPAGKDGAAGGTGPTGPTGETGLKGKEGSPWTAGGTLPPEATETGAWLLATGDGTVAISFPIPLAAPLAESNVHYVTKSEIEGTPPVACQGTAAEPEALPGHLCVYEKDNFAPSPPSPDIWDTSTKQSVGAFPLKGASRAGAALIVFGFEGLAWGTWAVTAP